MRRIFSADYAILVGVYLGAVTGWVNGHVVYYAVTGDEAFLLHPVTLFFGTIGALIGAFSIILPRARFSCIPPRVHWSGATLGLPLGVLSSITVGIALPEQWWGVVDIWWPILHLVFFGATILGIAAMAALRTLARASPTE